MRNHHQEAGNYTKVIDMNYSFHAKNILCFAKIQIILEQSPSSHPICSSMSQERSEGVSVS